MTKKFKKKIFNSKIYKFKIQRTILKIKNKNFKKFSNCYRNRVTNQIIQNYNNKIFKLKINNNLKNLYNYNNKF